MSLRAFLALISALVIVGAVVALYLPIDLNATTYQGTKITCGSVLSPDQTTAHQADLTSALTDSEADRTDYRGQCNAAAGMRKAIAFPAIAVAAIILVGALVVRRPARADG